MPKILKFCIYTFVVISFVFVGSKNVLAIDGGYNAANIVWGVGRINSFSLSKTAEPFWGATTGAVKINDVPADIASWGESFVNINVPSTVDGLGNIKVIGTDGTEFNAGQLLISIKIDSYPQEITLGDNVEITGEGFNNSEAGKVVNLSVGGYNQALSTVSWSDNKIVVSTANDNLFKIGQNTFKVFYGSSNANNGYQSRTFDLQIKEPKCTADVWSCYNWGYCLSSGTRTRSCNKTFDCQFVDTPSPETSQTCSTNCTAEKSYICSNWTPCSQTLMTKIRTCYKPTDWSWCDAPMPETEQSCTPACTADTWSCDFWGECQSGGVQARICTKTFDCPTATTPSPITSQNCTPPRPQQPIIPAQPTCTADTWTCDLWGACSLSGIQNRSCTKTFDCPNIQTAPPITDQFCEAPNRPQQTAPSESEEITNQDTIIKATVKLLCPVDEQKASQGSGTVIDSAGTILTNKHVIAGTLGCLVGFIDNFSDEPYFGDRQIADIVKVSSNQDIAVLKIRNPKNKALSYVNTTNGNVNFALGTKITTYGYPAKFGTKVTYTSGDFSGNDGGYLKTTAILEYGNSGGGAYLKNGTYIGIPSAVVKGELNAMGYILSINTIRAWLNNSSVASGNTNNNYSRVSVLEDIDLKKLGSLKLFIPNVDKNSNLVTPPPTANQNTPKTTDQTQVAPQQESVVIESNNKDSTSSVQNASSTPEQHPKISLIKRFFLWLSNLFNKLATR